jgi:trehalose synthase-fused probable maltokinase
MPSVDQDALREWVLEQRWFASKARDVPEVNIVELLELADEPSLLLGLVEARFLAGTHELYQLLVGDRGGRELAYDALAEPAPAAALARLLASGREVQGELARVAFHWVGEPLEEPSVRSLGAEQSNTSVVIDDRVILKVFRRLEAGDNPELEMLRFLTEQGFPNVPALAGWYELAGAPLDATLGVAQELVRDARDGWELVLDELGRSPEELIGDLRELGAVTGRLHTALGSDSTNADFAPDTPSDQALGIITATIDEEIERAFVDLPDIAALAPIAGRGEEVRDRLQLMSHVGSGGRLIRTHGDLHLGQTLREGGGDGRWVVIDFEGEPARPHIERRRKRSPLRDVAGMLRSFAYAASASGVLRATPAPEGWEERARDAYLEGYFGAVEPTLLPSGEANIRQLLGVFELEKAMYELQYELNNRPDWVGIPVAGIARLLEEPLA